ncbi:MAG: Maf family protein [Candidatus Gastranaerophilales bacterium]|nr:Maf family protein [Candidatus Gastranaerophilales bacterium]
MKKIILASASPRRQSLLLEAGLQFEVISPDFDESMINKSFSYEKIELLAANKGLSVLKKISEHAVIISADTVVIYDNFVLGKPKNYEEAFYMLSLLNGKTHKVVTSVCVLDNEKNEKIIKSETSEVTFNLLTDEDINNYIYTYKPYDKAGSYGIQELDEKFIKEIKGDYNNIVGLPVKTLMNMLNEI